MDSAKGSAETTICSGKGVCIGVGVHRTHTFAEVQAGDVWHEQHGDGHADGAAHGADNKFGSIGHETEHHARNQRAGLSAASSRSPAEEAADYLLTGCCAQQI